MLVTSTESQIEGYWISAYRGIVQGQTWDELLRNAELIGVNAILNIRFDNALDVDTLFHGSAVVLKRACSPGPPLIGPKRLERSYSTRRAR